MAAEIVMAAEMAEIVNCSGGAQIASAVHGQLDILINAALAFFVTILGQGPVDCCIFTTTLPPSPNISTPPLCQVPLPLGGQSLAIWATYVTA